MDPLRGGVGREFGSLVRNGRESEQMTASFERPGSAFPSKRQALVVLVAGVVMLAVAGLILVVGIMKSGQRVLEEVYYYQLFVRMRDPGASAELWVPVPDFPELRERTYIDGNFTDFPNTNVTQSIEESARGTMFRFLFSDSFAVWGTADIAPGSANGTLTFDSQVSSDVWIYLSNTSSDSQVSILLVYQVAQFRGFEADTQVFFVGTADPRGDGGSGLRSRCGYILDTIRDDGVYTVLSAGWGRYPLTDGGFAYYCGS